MQCKLICSSHSPLMRLYARAPAEHEQVLSLYARLKAQVADYQPDLVIVFGCDHYNGFHLNCVPPFCLGTRAEAVADVGGTPGQLDVPEELALGMAQSIRESDFDIAISYNMRIDHGFSQTMDFVMGDLNAYPVVPVFINSMVEPYVSFRRSRLLGDAVARAVSQQSVSRLLVIGTGGMSHNPRRYYPSLNESSEERVRHYQLHGPDNNGLTHQQWLDRLESMHQEGARMLVDGRRTRADIKMNPELDNAFAQSLCGDNPAALDDWDVSESVEQGGIGFTELHTWVSAASVFRAFEASLRPVLEIYAQTLEYGIGFGAMTGAFMGTSQQR